MVVVDKRKKYAHFLYLSHPFKASTMANKTKKLWKYPKATWNIEDYCKWQRLIFY